MDLNICCTVFSGGVFYVPRWRPNVFPAILAKKCCPGSQNGWFTAFEAKLVKIQWFFLKNGKVQIDQLRVGWSCSWLATQITLINATFWSLNIGPFFWKPCFFPRFLIFPWISSRSNLGGREEVKWPFLDFRRSGTKSCHFGTPRLEIVLLWCHLNHQKTTFRESQSI